MKYTSPSFSVPASGKAPADCKHGWLDVRGKCVMCGVQIEARVAVEQREAEEREWRPSTMFSGYEERDIPHGRQYRATWLRDNAAALGLGAPRE